MLNYKANLSKNLLNEKFKKSEDLLKRFLSEV